MKNQIMAIVRENCENHMFENNTAAAISERIHISRNEVASILSSLVMQKVLIKIENRPLFFLDRSFMEQEYQLELGANSYKSLELLFASGQHEAEDFDKLIGYDGSLADLVKQCKATIAYPPDGLPMLLYGPTGTGKSLIAKLAYEYARNHELLKDQGKFIAVNCSEYANNPELLTANLFGYVKGAFTGAEKEKAGLIELADGGVLFLDEVHNLKAECQEKLFQFMDQSIYHRVGDNETWYTSKVRLILATTEPPNVVLLKTLQRRIPMTITVPPLKQRGIQEKVQLLYSMFKEEEKRLNRTIKISTKVYNVLLSYDFTGNIGELKSCVQSCCINSLFQENDHKEMLIQLKSLPEQILNSIEKSSVYTASSDYIKLHDLQNFIHTEKEIIRLNEELLKYYTGLGKHEINEDAFLRNCRQTVWKYFDFTLLEESSQQVDFYHSGIQHIFGLVGAQYKLEFNNNDILSICSYLNSYAKDYHSFRNWSVKNKDKIEGLLAFMKDRFYREYSIAEEIRKYLISYLDIDILPMVSITFILYFKSLHGNEILQKRAGVILAHGFSTASSIADAVNKFLDNYVFDAIDMPLNVSMATVLQQLNTYLKKLGKTEELFLLVDMGSLEDIYKGLNLQNVNIGIINNISTRTALEIGNGILQDQSMEDIFKNVISGSVMNYHIEKNRQKKAAILCSCASGMGTAEKLKQTIEDSLPLPTEIHVLAYDYNELIEKKINSPLFNDYHVICVIGTLNPNIDQLKFIPIEDLIISDTIDDFDQCLKDFMSCEELESFKKSILKNFSLSNIMNSLTILNPNKLLEHVADAIDKLQRVLKVSLANTTCFGLYVHISCLIERLVMNKEIELYPDMNRFEEEHADFIHHIKETFYEVEKFYGVKIPTAEIGYIYDYVSHDVNYNS